MATINDLPDAPLSSETMVTVEEEDKALIQVMNISARNEASVEETLRVIHSLGLNNALDRVKMDVGIS